MLVQRAERAISKANPPIPPDVAGARKGVFQENTLIEPSVIRDMRAVHSKLTDTQFEARAVQAVDKKTANVARSATLSA